MRKQTQCLGSIFGANYDTEDATLPNTSPDAAAVDAADNQKPESDIRFLTSEIFTLINLSSCQLSPFVPEIMLIDILYYLSYRQFILFL
jgi:hypothetical protein